MDADEHTRRLAAEPLAGDDPVAWFERLYAAAEGGNAVIPWDRGGPNGLLVEWAEGRRLDGAGRRALVVGAGLGDDAEYLAGRGFDTLAFDVSASAVATARRRFPGSPVEYVTADLLDPPADWRQAFDLVFESLTVQSLPVALHREAIAQVARMVAPAGTLLVLAAARAGGPEPGPPWPLTRDEIEAFATGGLSAVRIEELRDAGQPSVRRWRAEFDGPGREDR